jgi:hypothetical protein
VTPEGEGHLGTDDLSALSRMELDDAGRNPERLAEAIHALLGEREGVVPVRDIARRLDIVEIREADLKSVEGVLVTTPERPQGMIAVNRNSDRRRQRFTLSHELGHFLMTHHVMVGSDGFNCSRGDMVARVGDHPSASINRHLQQEAEANRFAIELLAPKRRLRTHLNRQPDLARVLDISERFEISREAAARRYVELHSDRLAVLFGHRARIAYSRKGPDFPWLIPLKGRQRPDLPAGTGGLSSIDEADPADWLDRPRGVELSIQVLRQREDRFMVLLHAEHTDDPDHEDTGGMEDTAERFSRFNR